MKWLSAAIRPLLQYLIWIVNHGRHDLCPTTQMKWAQLHIMERLIHKHWYDGAHVSRRKRETPRCWALDLWCYDAPRYYPRWWSRHHSRLHQALFAQVLGLPRRLRQRFLVVDLSMRLGHPDNSLHSSAVRYKRWQISLKVWQCSVTECLFLHEDCLTFQIFILLAHCPHTDLVVDHIDTRKADSAAR